MSDKQDITSTALYTAGVWHWAGFSYADVVMPERSKQVFRFVTVLMFIIRLIKPSVESLRHSLVHRHAFIDLMLRDTSPSQVIEIGAGYSRRGCQFSESNNLDYFEIDLPHVSTGKENILGSSELGRQVLSRPNLHLLNGDLLTLDYAQFNAKPSFIISEGLMMYFNRAEQMTAWQAMSQFLKQAGGSYIFDYVPADVEAEESKVSSALAKRRQAKGKKDLFAYDGRTTQDMIDDLKRCGFRHIDVYKTEDIASTWPLPFSKSKTKVVLFHCCV